MAVTTTPGRMERHIARGYGCVLPILSYERHLSHLIEARRESAAVSDRRQVDRAPTIEESMTLRLCHLQYTPLVAPSSRDDENNMSPQISAVIRSQKGRCAIMRPRAVTSSSSYHVLLLPDSSNQPSGPDLVLDPEHRENV